MPNELLGRQGCSNGRHSDPFSYHGGFRRVSCSSYGNSHRSLSANQCASLLRICDQVFHITNSFQRSSGSERRMTTYSGEKLGLETIHNSGRPLPMSRVKHCLVIFIGIVRRYRLQVIWIGALRKRGANEVKCSERRGGSYEAYERSRLTNRRAPLDRGHGRNRQASKRVRRDEVQIT
jgi:hypothetical protein